MRGDRVEIVVDTGDGVRVYDIVATRAGRRVEISTGRSVIEVAEVTRTGNAVRTARFMASRVLALVEHPAAEEGPARPASGAGTARHGPRAGPDVAPTPTPGPSGRTDDAPAQAPSERDPTAGWDW